MNWRYPVQRLGSWLFRGRAAPASQQVSTAKSPAVRQSIESTHDHYLTHHRVRTWRRRVLLHKGERIRIHMIAAADAAWLAMLDDEGMVLACFHTTGVAVTYAHVLDRHVAQFYAPQSIADVLARDHLRAAAQADGSQHLGWRCGPNGVLFWAMTTIEPVLLRDGRLQGFSHVMRNADGASANPNAVWPAGSVQSLHQPGPHARLAVLRT
jgi:hypothetical protein